MSPSRRLDPLPLLGAALVVVPAALVGVLLAGLAVTSASYLALHGEGVGGDSSAG